MKFYNQKRTWIIGIVVAVLISLPILYCVGAFCADKLKYKKLEKYYHADVESFDSIVKYFEGLYKDNLCNVEYDCDNTYLEYKLKYTDALGETTYLFEEVECKKEYFVSELTKLREKYQKYCDYPVFSNIEACYDKEGNMLLYMQVYNEKISEEEKRGYYLVYVKEGYSGNNSFIGIDTLGRVTREPFTDNWYTWSMDWPFG